jgi:hypothetical protein
MEEEMCLVDSYTITSILRKTEGPEKVTRGGG